MLTINPVQNELRQDVIQLVGEYGPQPVLDGLRSIDGSRPVPPIEESTEYDRYIATIVGPKLLFLCCDYSTDNVTALIPEIEKHIAGLVDILQERNTQDKRKVYRAILSEIPF
tara:strand:- start:645 stop:983 length:339 start_codon:yes stop_codon:yes gene_type:complete